MAMLSLSPGPLFKEAGFNRTSTPVGPRASSAEIRATFQRESFHEEVDWPPDSPVAQTYDVRNTSSKLVLLNNKQRHKRLRGYENHKPLSTDPERHGDVNRKNECRHESCTDSSSPMFEPKPKLKERWINQTMRPPWTPVENNFTDPRRHVSCRVSSNPATMSLENSKVHKASGVQRIDKRPAISMRDNSALVHPDMPNSSKKYMYFISKTYDMTNMKQLKQLQYRDILLRQQYLGYNSDDEYRKYMKYLEGPRKRQFGGSSPLFMSGKRSPLSSNGYTSPRSTTSDTDNGKDTESQTLSSRSSHTSSHEHQRTDTRTRPKTAPPTQSHRGHQQQQQRTRSPTQYRKSPRTKSPRDATREHMRKLAKKRKEDNTPRQDLKHKENDEIESNKSSKESPRSSRSDSNSMNNTKLSSDMSVTDDNKLKRDKKSDISDDEANQGKDTGFKVEDSFTSSTSDSKSTDNSFSKENRISEADKGGEASIVPNDKPTQSHEDKAVRESEQPNNDQNKNNDTPKDEPTEKQQTDAKNEDKQKTDDSFTDDKVPVEITQSNPTDTDIKDDKNGEVSSKSNDNAANGQEDESVKENKQQSINENESIQENSVASPKGTDKDNGNINGRDEPQDITNKGTSQGVMDKTEIELVNPKIVVSSTSKDSESDQDIFNTASTSDSNEIQNIKDNQKDKQLDNELKLKSDSDAESLGNDSIILPEAADYMGKYSPRYQQPNKDEKDNDSIAHSDILPDPAAYGGKYSQRPTSPNDRANKQLPKDGKLVLYFKNDNDLNEPLETKGSLSQHSKNTEDEGETNQVISQDTGSDNEKGPKEEEPETLQSESQIILDEKLANFKILDNNPTHKDISEVHEQKSSNKGGKVDRTKATFLSSSEEDSSYSDSSYDLSSFSDVPAKKSPKKTSQNTNDNELNEASQNYESLVLQDNQSENNKDVIGIEAQGGIPAIPTITYSNEGQLYISDDKVESSEDIKQNVRVNINTDYSSTYKDSSEIREQQQPVQCNKGEGTGKETSDSSSESDSSDTDSSSSFDGSRNEDEGDNKKGQINKALDDDAHDAHQEVRIQRSNSKDGNISELSHQNDLTSGIISQKEDALSLSSGKDNTDSGTKASKSELTIPIITIDTCSSVTSLKSLLPDDDTKQNYDSTSVSPSDDLNHEEKIDYRSQHSVTEEDPETVDIENSNNAAAASDSGFMDKTHHGNTENPDDVDIKISNTVNEDKNSTGNIEDHVDIKNSDSVAEDNRSIDISPSGYSGEPGHVDISNSDGVAEDNRSIDISSSGNSEDPGCVDIRNSDAVAEDISPKDIIQRVNSEYVQSVDKSDVNATTKEPHGDQIRIDPELEAPAYVEKDKNENTGHTTLPDDDYSITSSTGNNIDTLVQIYENTTTPNEENANEIIRTQESGDTTENNFNNDGGKHEYLNSEKNTKNPEGCEDNDDLEERENIPTKTPGASKGNDPKRSPSLSSLSSRGSQTKVRHKEGVDRPRTRLGQRPKTAAPASKVGRERETSSDDDDDMPRASFYREGVDRPKSRGDAAAE